MDYILPVGMADGKLKMLKSEAISKVDARDVLIVTDLISMSSKDGA